MRLYTSSSFGDLATFLMLDNRQHRSDQACGSPGDLGGQLVEDCAERTAAARTMLGPEQERWVGRQLTTAAARWKIVGQQMLMAQLEQKAGAGGAWWSDGWDGYPASRERGYVRVEATPATWRADLRAVSTVARPEAQAHTLTSWVVESGRAGAQPA
jgi:phosphodiesterase/alkaline phosphatase D-like protein